MENDTDVMMDVYLTRDQREAYERLRKDAERYRFFRAALLDQHDNRLAALDDLPQPANEAEFDAGIDAAMNGANV